MRTVILSLTLAVAVVEDVRAELPDRLPRDGLVVGVSAVSPTFLTGGYSDLAGHPGLGIHSRLGWDFPNGLTAELELGTSWIPFAEMVMGHSWVGPRVRYTLRNRTAFSPLLGAGLALHFWDTSDTKTEVSFGQNLLVGGAVELMDGFIDLEATAQFDHSSPGNVSLFVDGNGEEHGQLWLSFFIGFAVHWPHFPAIAM